jgi:2-polyprenyl-3-methyl-5-hydroxy-6-metoxy-1,4-benzoquinol methylase
LATTRCALCGSDDSESEALGYDFEYDTVPNRFAFVRCHGCDHVYLNPRPGPADLAAIYPPDYYAFGGASNPLVARLRRRWEGGKVRMYRELLPPGPRRVLDVGCGNGRFLSLLRDFGDPEWELVGIDIDAAAVDQCQAEGFEAHVTRVEDFAGRDGQFDLIIMLQLIEHVEDPAVLSERVYKLLRPGGAFVVETPNLAGWDYAVFHGSTWGHYHFPRHWNLFSTPALHRMLERCGFAIERSEYLISTSAWIISLHNFFLDRAYPRWFVSWFHYQNPILLAGFVLLDSLRAKLGYATSNQRVVARRPA